MPRVKILKPNVRVAGVPFVEGEEYEVTDSQAVELVRLGCGEEVADPPVDKEPRVEPEVKTLGKGSRIRQHRPQ